MSGLLSSLAAKLAMVRAAMSLIFSLPSLPCPLSLAEAPGLDLAPAPWPFSPLPRPAPPIGAALGSPRLPPRW